MWLLRNKIYEKLRQILELEERRKNGSVNIKNSNQIIKVAQILEGFLASKYTLKNYKKLHLVRGTCNGGFS